MSNEDIYNLRSKNKRKFKNPFTAITSRKNIPKRRKFLDSKITTDGYIEDDFVVQDDDNINDVDDYNYIVDNEYFDVDSRKIQEDIINQLVKQIDIDENSARKIVASAFKNSGKYLIKNYVGAIPSDDNWKLGLPSSTIKKIEPELKKIRNLISEETPTIPKILSSNITIDDKKRCIVLFDQLNNIEPYTEEHSKKIEEINNIIRKGKHYTINEIKQLEATEKRLKSIASPPDNLKNRILTLNANEDVKAIIYGQYLEMLEHEVGSQSYNSIREEIEWSVRLPHNKAHVIADLSEMDSTKLNKFYTDFLETMNKELFGLENVKMHMLHIINDRRSSGDICGRNIALVGPPGTGKTAISKAFAKSLQVPFEKISVGGMDDASILKGSDRVWNSSSPSIILQILSRIKSSSGVVLFDEVDKLGETPKGREVQYALLHITDYVHNKEFRDNYLNKYTHDFSKILFMFAANKIEGIDSALLSRLDVVNVPPYNIDEKKTILKNYVLPRALTTIGMNSSDVIIDDKAIHKLICSIKDDLGIRTIEKIIKSVVGKINMYKSVLLDDGTTGDLKLSYKIPNFTIPLYINTKLLIYLTKDKIKY